MKYLTNLKNRIHHEPQTLHDTLRLCALTRPLSQEEIWASINGIMNDRRDEGKTDSVNDDTSHSITNDDSVIHTAIQEHCAVLGLVNHAEKASDMKKDVIPLFCSVSCFRTESSNARRIWILLKIMMQIR